jgi:hypothetical protein
MPNNSNNNKGHNHLVLRHLRHLRVRQLNRHRPHQAEVMVTRTFLLRRVFELALASGCLNDLMENYYRLLDSSRCLTAVLKICGGGYVIFVYQKLGLGIFQGLTISMPITSIIAANFCILSEKVTDRLVSTLGSSFAI